MHDAELLAGKIIQISSKFKPCITIVIGSFWDK
jgi:hypothetical protein